MNIHFSKSLLFTPLLLFIMACSNSGTTERDQQIGGIKISENDRFFTTAGGDPFFWLGDTGWLLFSKLNREEAEKYLENRRQKGFNVIQVMALHVTRAVNAYGDSALVNGDVSTPNVTEGASFADAGQYDFWDHVDFIVDKAAEKDLYMALVPIWGSNVKSGKVDQAQGQAYASWLAERYGHKPNIIWLNGGDVLGSDSTAVWNRIGATLAEKDTSHLITFHPRGRKMSSTWFHNEAWLDFNMFQSGHRNYEQDTARSSHRFGPDNWKYVQVDYHKKPVKPTVDGEPSYEGIPQGLHDTTQVYWKDKDVRRYGYWAIFAGAAGYTYGHSAVMQFYKPTDDGSAYGAREYWTIAINSPGAGQMIHLKNLMLSRPYFERVPDQSLIANQGGKYEYLMATRGEEYAFIYTYTGRNIQVRMGKIEGDKVKGTWYSPRNGETTEIGEFDNQGVVEFDPPGEQEEGNDWVLILDKV